MTKFKNNQIIVNSERIQTKSILANVSYNFNFSFYQTLNIVFELVCWKLIPFFHSSEEFVRYFVPWLKEANYFLEKYSDFFPSVNANVKKQTKKQFG